MVSFICNTCQETVRKAQVDKHYQFKCRNCWALSCVDCGVVFEGDAYKEHTSCISEAEKYQGALYQAPKKGAGKLDPQERWTDLVERLGEEAKADGLKVSAQARELLVKMGDSPNVPRKEKKFYNFVNSAFHSRPQDPATQEVWALLQKRWAEDKVALDKAKADAKAKAEAEAKAKAEAEAEAKAEAKAGAKAEENGGKSDDRAWQKEVKKALKKNKSEMPVKDLLKALKEKKYGVNKKALKAFLQSKPRRYQLTKAKTVELLEK